METGDATKRRMKMRKFKLLKRSVPLWAVLLICAVAASSVLAAIVVSRQLSASITIEAVYDIEIYDTDKTTILTSVDFGVATRGEAKTLPDGGLRYYIKNTGDKEIWISFTVANAPADVTFKVSYTDPNTQTQVLSGEITSFSIAPGVFQDFLVQAWVSDTAEFGTFNPTITFNALNTATG
jgi:hypothetical protein